MMITFKVRLPFFVLIGSLFLLCIAYIAGNGMGIAVARSAVTATPFIADHGTLDIGVEMRAMLAAGEQQQWAFDGHSNDQLSLFLKVVDGDLDSTLNLYLPDGTRMAWSTPPSDVNAQIGPIVLTETGTYHVVVGSESGAGNYTLLLDIYRKKSTEDVAATPTAIPDANASTPTATILNSDFYGELSPNEWEIARLQDGEEHLWRYQGIEGQTITIVLKTVAKEVDPYLELRGPAGEVLAANDNFDDHNAQIGPMMLPVSGTYAISVQSRTPANNREYSVYVKMPIAAVSNATTVNFHWQDYAPANSCRARNLPVATEQEEADALTLLQQRPFNFSHTEWLGNRAVFAPPPALPEEHETKTEAQTRQELEDFLTLRFPDQPQRVKDGLSLLDHPVLVAKIPDYRLRAALLTNLGTVGEVAIDVLLNDQQFQDAFSSISFTERPVYDPIGYVRSNSQLQTLEVHIATVHRNESIDAIGSVLFHELLHIDLDKTLTNEQAIGPKEETINGTLELMVTLQNNLLQPDHWRTRRVLTRQQNQKVAALLNSATESGAAIDPNRIDGRSIYPGETIIIDNFSDWHLVNSTAAAAERDTPGNPVLRAALDWLSLCSGRPVKPNSDFDTATYTWISNLYRDKVLFSDAQILQVMTNLGMIPPEVFDDPMPTAFPPLVFISMPEGESEIYRLNTDGSIQNLTNNPSSDGRPVWSPDGSQLVFGTLRDGNAEIYLMNADGTNTRNLTRNKDADRRPSWSPDGTQLVFASNRNGAWGLYVMNADGRGVRKLISVANSVGGVDNPLWSPDGAHIIYESTEDSSRSLRVIDANGRNMNVVLNTETNKYVTDVDWSPDGKKIVFASNHAGDLDLYSMNVDGSDLRNLTNDVAGEINPAWSPDGTKIVFASNRSGNSGIFVMDADGNNVQALSDTSDVETNGAWSPDGKYVVFHANRAGNIELYMVNVESGMIQRLTNRLIDDLTPAWQPNTTLDGVICTVSAARNINLRGGPGTNYAQVGTLTANNSIRATEQVTSADGQTWWHLANGAWVRSDVVETKGDCAALPQAVTP